jgi:hypothetical protein
MLYAFQNVVGVPQKKRALPRRDKMHRWNEFRTYINQRLISETTQSLQGKNVGPSGLPIVKRDTTEYILTEDKGSNRTCRALQIIYGGSSKLDSHFYYVFGLPRVKRILDEHDAVYELRLK